MVKRLHTALARASSSVLMATPLLVVDVPNVVGELTGLTLS